jgi:hypothetical protein
MFLANLGAEPVHKLLGKKDLGTSEFPPIGATLVDGDIGFRQHTAGTLPGQTADIPEVRGEVHCCC